MKEPQYSAKEVREMRAEVRKLRDRAVRDWSRPGGGRRQALVLMTFGDYLKLTEKKATT